MGASLAILGPLGSAVGSIERFVVVFFSVYQFALLAYILSSWIRRMPASLVRVQRFLYEICEPYLRVFRRFLPSFGPLDLSPIVGLLALGLVERLVILILDQLR
jgi:uncharacterized protein YggT (Ycf19 family)